MPSEHYKRYWQVTNEWLQANAPDYVIKCVEELAQLTQELGEELLRCHKAVLKAETFTHELAILANEAQQIINDTNAAVEALGPDPGEQDETK